jgi:hypothetical protein
MHIHIGALDAVKVFLYVIIVGFFWRIIAGSLSDSPVGQAMSYLY